MGPLHVKGENAKNQQLVSTPMDVSYGIFPPRSRETHCFEAGKLTITLMFIIANALDPEACAERMSRSRSRLLLRMLSAGFGPIAFLIIVNVILLIGGQFMEPSGLSDHRSAVGVSNRHRAGH